MAKPIIVENGCLVCHRKIKDAPQSLLSTFLFGATSLILLFIALQGIFLNFVIKPLKNLSSLFKGIVEGTEPLNQKIEVKTKDEISVNLFVPSIKWLYIYTKPGSY
jgi:two-component system NtrC family sensor kinase